MDLARVSRRSDGCDQDTRGVEVRTSAVGSYTHIVGDVRVRDGSSHGILLTKPNLQKQAVYCGMSIFWVLFLRGADICLKIRKLVRSGIQTEGSGGCKD